MNRLIDEIRRKRTLSTLVENKTTFSADHFELSMFETYRIANQVELIFDFPVITSMLTGKKVMHLEGGEPFDFFPGQSVVFPSKEKMIIDFPLANLDAPTQCLALGIDESKIERVVHKFNDHIRIEDEINNWQLTEVPSHLLQDVQISHLIDRIMHTFIKENRSKDVLLDLMINELIVRLLQTKAKSLILNDIENAYADTRIGFIVKFIRDNLTDHNMSVEFLANKVYMSTSHFHKKFKAIMGISPIEFLNAEKVKFSKALMSENQSLRIAEVAYLSGFNSSSYFNRQFKKYESISPIMFKASLKQ